MKLTKSQKDVLARAERDGNPFKTLSIRQRSGGAIRRCADRLRSDGMLDASYAITPAGMEALYPSPEKKEGAKP